MVCQHRPTTIIHQTLQAALSTNSPIHRTNRRRGPSCASLHSSSSMARRQAQEIVTTSAAPFDEQASHQKPQDAPPHAESALEPGCVLGTPVAWGTPRRSMNIGDTALDLQMLLHIQHGDCRAVRKMILAGWRPKTVPNCSFVMVLNDDTASRQLWEVSAATPLHFALGGGFFQAAAVLLVAFPEQADVACRAQEKSGEERHQWTALDMINFLAVVFQDKPTKSAKYSEAGTVLLWLQRNSAAVPFLNIPSPVHRLLALGPCPSADLATLVSTHQ
mmetsp:Transcript_3822/g.9310  ORF Transcript_3822/g.9310 Transcript_3822/m.9310 type:complete len:275 (-) Transcript_3822:14-838(-)